MKLIVVSGLRFAHMTVFNQETALILRRWRLTAFVTTRRYPGRRYWIVRKQSDARSREIVVALVGEEATVKTLRRFGRRVELHPANPAYVPIVPDPSEFSLLGKVIEIRRTL